VIKSPLIKGETEEAY